MSRNNYRTRYKSLCNDSLISKTEHLFNMSEFEDSYFKEFIYCVAQLNIRGINHKYSYKGKKVQ